MPVKFSLFFYPKRPRAMRDKEIEVEDCIEGLLPAKGYCSRSIRTINIKLLANFLE